MSLIDTHLHLLDPRRFSYPWTASFPALHETDFRLSQFDALRSGLPAEITSSIFMECDVAEDQIAAEAAHYCALAEDPSNKLAGVIASCRPENDGFAASIDAMLHPGLVGFRRVLHTMPDELSTTTRFRESIRALGRRDIPFDLCLLSTQHHIGADLIDSCPGTRFMLDHCGVPPIASGDLSAWRSQITDLARRPNLHCKISGVIAYATPPVSADALRPVVEHVIQAFGWQRVVWGSDWPVCALTGGLSAWLTLLNEILASCSAAELSQLHSQNARSFYKLLQ